MAFPRAPLTAKLSKRLRSQFRYKSTRRRAIRVGLIASNAIVLGVIMVFVLQGSRPDKSAAPALLSESVASKVTNPLDQVSSADIALTVAKLSSLPETTAINNQAQSQAADMAISASSSNVVAKPQVVTTALKSSADIKDYKVMAGDTVSSIAAKFGVTSDSLRWSNGLTGEVVTVGAKISIPPVNGIVYTVNNGDTPDSLAAKFKTSKEKIVAYNDAEIKGLLPGQRIIVPDGVQSSAAPASANSTSGRGATAWGSSPIYGYNGYDFGYCTWYVANRMPVPANWGNANTWAYYAGLSGWNVSTRPVKGSIGQSSAGAFGHVAVIDDVSDDGTMIKYSDMNGLRGWGREGTTPNWVSASKFQRFIYR